MALGPTYQKYGGFATPDFRALNQGQQAVSDRFKEAIGGVQNLLKQSEEQYRQENTLNMQEYLKNNLRNAGLGAKPVDKTAIQQKFGNMINMEQLDQTIADETKQIQTEAINQASLAANLAMQEKGDPLLGRKAFADAMRQAGASESLTNQSVAAWSDSKAVEFKDMETLKARKEQADLSDFFADVSQTGNVDAAIAARIAHLPQEEQILAKRRYMDEYQKESALLPEQVEERDYYLALNANTNKQYIAEKQQQLALLQQQYDALQKTGIPDSAYTLANELSTKLGSSPTAAIADRVTNWVESFHNKNDGQVIKGVYQSLVKNGVEAQDANAALVQAFQEIYPGDSWTGNNLSSSELAAIKARAEQLGTATKNRNLLTPQITKARLALTDAENAAERAQINLRQQLTQAGRNQRMQVDGEKGMDTTYSKFKNQLFDALNTSKVPTASSPMVVGGHNIKSYATDPDHERKVQDIYNKMPVFTDAQQIDAYITDTNADSPLTGDMVVKAAQKHGVNPRVLVAIMQQDSSLGTKGKGARTFNPGNVGNDDEGNEVTFGSWEEGVDAVAKWLGKNRVSDGTNTAAADDNDPKKLVDASRAEAAKTKILTAAPTADTSPPPAQSKGTMVRGFGNWKLPNLFESAPREAQVKQNIAALKKALEKSGLSKNQKKELEDKIIANEAFLKKIKG